MQDPPPEPLAHRAANADGERLFFHASAVALDGQGILILGPSGSGKSTLALGLMAEGARLICDDGVWLDGTRLCRPDHAPALIEARGVGLLQSGPVQSDAPLKLVIDLSRPEPQRLPPRRRAAGPVQNVDLILGAGQHTFIPAILHLVRFGRLAP